MQNVAIICNAEDFFARQFDQHMIDYRWNKRIAGYQLDKLADAVKMEAAKIVARLKNGK